MPVKTFRRKNNHSQTCKALQWDNNYIEMSEFFEDNGGTDVLPWSYLKNEFHFGNKNYPYTLHKGDWLVKCVEQVDIWPLPFKYGENDFQYMWEEVMDLRSSVTEAENAVVEAEKKLNLAKMNLQEDINRFRALPQMKKAYQDLVNIRFFVGNTPSGDAEFWEALKKAEQIAVSKGFGK